MHWDAFYGKLEIVKSSIISPVSMVRIKAKNHCIARWVSLTVRA